MRFPLGQPLKAIALVALASLGWLTLSGCHSPKVRGGPPPLPSPAGALDANQFEAVPMAAGIRAEWLRPPTNFFTLGPGDQIEIENLSRPEERAELALVGPDGKIYYSMLPGLPVWGRTLSETKQLLEREMNRYTRQRPELTLTLRRVNSKRIWILGSVEAPGVYSMATPLTILEAISLAGGPLVARGGKSGMPNLDNSFIMRDGQMLPLDLQQLLSRGDLSQNIYLQPDDFLYIRSSRTDDVTVLGGVATPNIVNYHSQLSLLSAVAAVGGALPYANVSQVAVVRGSLTLPRIAVVNYRAIALGQSPDVLLEPGDIVYVPFVWYRKLGELAEQMLGTLVRTIAANEGNRAVIPDAAPIGVTVPGAGTVAQ